MEKHTALNRVLDTRGVYRVLPFSIVEVSNRGTILLRQKRFKRNDLLFVIWRQNMDKVSCVIECQTILDHIQEGNCGFSMN